MQNYKAPQRDTLFALNELFGFEKHYADLGFDEVTNFVKYFKKHTGTTPNEFRKTPKVRYLPY